MSQELLFDKLFDFAIRDWPKEITFGSLSYYETPDGSSGYTIEKLNGFPEDIEKKCSASPIKIILEKLHYNIYNLLGYAARDLLMVRVKDLRVETIKKDLESDLKKCLEHPGSIAEKDLDIIREYFSVNES